MRGSLPAILKGRSSLFVSAVVLLFTCFAGQAAAADDLPQPQIAPWTYERSYDLPPQTGFVPPPGDFSSVVAPLAGTRLALTAQWDWREAGKVTPVRSQGSCGSCYAFAAIACFESRLLIDGAGTFDLSENSVKECEWFGSSCGGGNDWIVSNYLSASGTVLETCDPYVASDVACDGDCPYQHTALGWNMISFSQVPSAEVLKSYIQTYGPIYTSMYAGDSDAWSSEFRTYNGSYTLYHPGAEAPNHAVLIVGWDDTLTHAGGQGAWIVKNSWGTSWGGTCGHGTQRGYFTIAYGSASIGSYSSFVSDWQEFDATGDLLMMDEGGYTGSVGYMSTTIWGLCKFVPTQDWEVNRVEFWTLDATTDVDVYIYDTFASNTVSNLLTSRLNSSFALAGYHSVELAAPLHIEQGNDIYAVVKITNASGIYPLAFDAVGPKTAGYSAISPNGSYFSLFSNGDVGIRLRVGAALSCGETTVNPVITGVTDRPADGGGFVNIAWRRSTYDAEESSPRIRMYRIWRKRPGAAPGGAARGQTGEIGDGLHYEGPIEAGPQGSAWQLLATVPAGSECCYSLTAATNGDSEPGDTCWTYFYVSAHTGRPGERFDSEVVRGCSIDNRTLLDPPDGNPATPDTLPEPGEGLSAILSPPWPNPAVDMFSLQYEIAQPAPVSLAVYDASGRQVAELVNGYAARGSHIERWPATTGDRPPAPGVYFARLVAGSEVRTAKLVVAR
jgi:C1A family cysteine protease